MFGGNWPRRLAKGAVYRSSTQIRLQAHVRLCQQGQGLGRSRTGDGTAPRASPAARGPPSAPDGSGVRVPTAGPGVADGVGSDESPNSHSGWSTGARTPEAPAAQIPTAARLPRPRLSCEAVRFEQKAGTK